MSRITHQRALSILRGMPKPPRAAISDRLSIAGWMRWHRAAMRGEA
jgi:hypothetical protein